LRKIRLSLLNKSKTLFWSKEKMKDIFVKEDISKPENRVNLALFHLQADENFHRWFCDKLGIPASSVIYPIRNSEGNRPDYAVKNNGEIIGYVEVELGDENRSQISSYKEKYEKNGVKIFSVTGKSYHNSDLSLEEIAEYFKKNLRNFANPQKELSALYFIKLVETYSTHASSNPRIPISEEMRNHSFVKKLLGALADVEFLEGKKRGRRGVAVINTVGEKGFSFRVYSEKAQDKTLSLFWIKGGENLLTFQKNNVKYEQYLGHKPKEIVEKWLDFISNNLNLSPERKVSFDKIEENFDEFVRLIKLLI
jgi:hypothetical protein